MACLGFYSLITPFLCKFERNVQAPLRRTPRGIPELSPRAHQSKHSGQLGETLDGHCGVPVRQLIRCEPLHTNRASPGVTAARHVGGSDARALPRKSGSALHARTQPFVYSCLSFFFLFLLFPLKNILHHSCHEHTLSSLFIRVSAIFFSVFILSLLKEYP